MWSIYAPRNLGVAVQSTAEAIRASLKSSDREVMMRSVNYIDYSCRSLGSNAIDLLSCKRSEFQFEQEVRFFVALRGDELDAIRAAQWAETPVRRLAIGDPAPSVVVGPGYGSADKSLSRRSGPAGVHLTTHVATLIQRVHIAPGSDSSLRRAVSAIVTSSDLPANVISETSLDSPPFDEVAFHDMRSTAFSFAIREAGSGRAMSDSRSSTPNPSPPPTPS
jgi:hypothetical protein